MNEPKTCPYCGADISHKQASAKHCGSTRCEGKHRRAMRGKEINLKCTVCEKPLSKGQAKYCSKECRGISKSRKASERYKIALRGDKICLHCGKPIPRNIKNWWQRNFCEKPECDAQRKERVKAQKKAAVERHREKINALPVAGVKKQYFKTKPIEFMKNRFNKNDPEYFDHEMYLKKQKELKKKNGRKCVICGKALVGEQRIWCEKCKHAMNSVADNIRWDDGYSFSYAGSDAKFNQ